MTIEDVVGPIVFPVCLAIAVIATVLMLLHVARRYPSSPKNVPIGLRFDGRPRGLAPKLILWLAPAMLALVFLIVVATTVVTPVAADQRTTTALLFLILAETAALVAWTTDRQIELARKQTFRIAPSRTLLVAFPLLATVAVLIVIAVRAGAS